MIAASEAAWKAFSPRGAHGGRSSIGRSIRARSALSRPGRHAPHGRERRRTAPFAARSGRRVKANRACARAGRRGAGPLRPRRRAGARSPSLPGADLSRGAARRHRLEPAGARGCRLCRRSRPDLYHARFVGRGPRIPAPDGSRRRRPHRPFGADGQDRARSIRGVPGEGEGPAAGAGRAFHAPEGRRGRRFVDRRLGRRQRGADRPAELWLGAREPQPRRADPRRRRGHGRRGPGGRPADPRQRPLQDRQRCDASLGDLHGFQPRLRSFRRRGECEDLGDRSDRSLDHRGARGCGRCADAGPGSPRRQPGRPRSLRQETAASVRRGADLVQIRLAPRARRDASEPDRALRHGRRRSPAQQSGRPAIPARRSVGENRLGRRRQAASHQRPRDPGGRNAHQCARLAGAAARFGRCMGLSP